MRRNERLIDGRLSKESKRRGERREARGERCKCGLTQEQRSIWERAREERQMRKRAKEAVYIYVFVLESGRRLEGF